MPGQRTRGGARRRLILAFGLHGPGVIEASADPPHEIAWVRVLVGFGGPAQAWSVPSSPKEPVQILAYPYRLQVVRIPLAEAQDWLRWGTRYYSPRGDGFLDVPVYVALRRQRDGTWP